MINVSFFSGWQELRTFASFLDHLFILATYLSLGFCHLSVSSVIDGVERNFLPLTIKL